MKDIEADFSLHIYASKMRYAIPGYDGFIGGVSVQEYLPDDGKMHGVHVARANGVTRAWINNRLVYDESRSD